MKFGKSSRGGLYRQFASVACTCVALSLFSLDARACDPDTYYDLTMQIQDAGQNPGTVSPGVGVHTYLSGTQVVLEATANTGWVFEHWSSGGQTIATNPLTITMDSDKIVTAIFAVDTAVYYTLAMAREGDGQVVPAVGVHIYPENTIVPVSATDVTGWRFDHWEGDLTGSTTPQNLVMDTNKSLTAIFLEQFELSTSVIGMGSIGVAPDQPEYNSGALVVLTAQPDAGYHFKEWSGDLSGHTNPNLLLMDSDKSVTATFVEPFTLTLTPASQISASPTGPQYVPHTVVTLTANPGMGEVFSHWVAAGEAIDFSRSNPATITMDENKTVNAVFVSSSTTFYPLTITVQGNGTVLPVSGSYPENT